MQRPAPTIEFDAALDDPRLDGRPADSLRNAMRTAHAVKSLWNGGAPPDLAGVLETHPGLRNYRTVVVELAGEEYRLRTKAGEALDHGEFANRFSSFERSIAYYLEAQSVVDNDPKLAALKCGMSLPEPGSVFLGFRLLRELGRGAAGRVFLASELALSDRLVALKVTVEGCHEAEMLGRLQHANIVPIHSVQEEAAGCLTAICMPFRGQATLAAVLDCMYARSIGAESRRPPRRASAILDAIRAANGGGGEQGAEIGRAADPCPPDQFLKRAGYVDGVIHLCVQLADALAHAHAHGIFHRDLKPSNILMAPDGRPLLLDFNLSVDHRSPVWRIGGTLPYMAPEELSALCESAGRETHYDARSDVFSLGVILYELLTGDLPFGKLAYDQSAEEIAARLLKTQAKGPHPLRKLNDQVDKRLAGLIESCLAFDPELRPPSAEVLASALRQELALSRRTRRWTAAHRGIVLAAGAAALSIVLGTVVYVSVRPPYQIRQFQLGLAYYREGKDDLALQSLNAAIAADPRQSDALVARARVHQRRGAFQLAFADYDAANQLDPRPETAACEGYCLNKLAQYQQATKAYRTALDGGYNSPAVLNNLGYCWLRLGRLEDAEACLRRALRADDELQAAHHNLVVVFQRRALAGQPILPDAVAHARRALEIGPESGELCCNLAFFYALAARENPAFLQAAVANIAKAVEHGIDPKTFQSDPVFSAMAKDPSFQKALIVRGPSRDPVKAIRVVDPAAKTG
jgi:serine/threonine protein kinase/Tfp pilus assembly protein PilF